MLNQIVTYHSRWSGQRCVIDGIGRLEISLAQGGAAIPTHDRGPIDDDRAEREAVSPNTALRHLTPDEMAAYRDQRNKDIVADRLAGDSYNIIAQRFGLHYSTIQAIVEQWESTSGNGRP